MDRKGLKPQGTAIDWNLGKSWNKIQEYEAKGVPVRRSNVVSSILGYVFVYRIHQSNVHPSVISGNYEADIKIIQGLDKNKMTRAEWEDSKPGQAFERFQSIGWTTVNTNRTLSPQSLLLKYCEYGSALVNYNKSLQRAIIYRHSYTHYVFEVHCNYCSKLLMNTEYWTQR